MLYDRSYMRSQERETSPIKRASVVTILLVVTISIFVLQHVVNVSFPGAGGRPNTFLTNWFALSPQGFRELKVWTVFTYAFLHSTSSIWHILLNMLVLFSFGRTVETLLGKQQFLVLYFSSAIIGGLTYLFFHLNDASTVVGASAAVSAVVAFFCLRFYERPITFLLYFVIPVTIKPKWLFWGFLAISTYLLFSSELSAISANRAGVAHSAHLGGLLTGAVYYRYIYSRQTVFGNTFGHPGIELPKWFRRRKKTESKMSYQVNRPTRNRDEFQKEVDRILDKINMSGFSSLNDKEKATLDKAKELLNR